MNKPIIAPSILSADMLKLGEQIKAAEQAGADWIHIDVMDGVFVPNITIGPFIVEAARRATSLPLDVHLMIDRPERYIKEFVSAGADYLVIHAEATTHLHRTVQEISEAGVKAGVSLNPATPLETLKYVLDDIDLVLLMSVNPGFGGQSFIPSALDKTSTLRDMRDERNLEFLIEIDGGVKPSNVAEVVNAGADAVVMGSAFYGSDDYEQLVKTVRENVKNA